MIPFIIGGAVIAITTGLALKKSLEDSTYCHACNTEFGIITWKHECTHCKNIFCDDCIDENDSMELCKKCNDKYEEKKAIEEEIRKKKEAKEKARYTKNLKNWIGETKQEYMKGFNIIEDLGIIEINTKNCETPREVEIQIKHQALLINANAYIKFFYDKQIEHHEEEYVAGYGSKGNPYMRTNRYTEKYFTGYATAVILKKK